MTDALTALSEAGVSIWLDDLSRERLMSGSLARLAARDHVVGVTTNPSIFAKAITEGDAYGPQLHDLAARGVQTAEALRALTTFDVRWASRSPRRGRCGGWSTGPTCSSRSRPRGRDCRRSPRASPRGSASTSR